MKLGTKLIVYLVVTVIITMLIHGYLSIKQDRENVSNQMRLGMRGLARSIQATLGHFYGDRRSLSETQKFIDTVGPKDNIHGVVVYDTTGEPVSISSSLKETERFPELAPDPILQLDPSRVIKEGKSRDGYIQGPGLLIYYRIEPIFNSEEQPAGAFVVARHGPRMLTNIEARRNRIVATTSALVVLLSVLILILVRRNVSSPINELIERIGEIGKGHWEQRIKVSGHNEISSLAQEFNNMSERLQHTYARLVAEQQEKLRLERELRHSDKLASVGQLAAGLAHEIGTPLNIIGGRAESLLRRERAPEEIQENLQIIRSQIDRIAGIVRQLLEFSRRKERAVRAVEVPSLLAAVGNLLRHKIEEKSATVELTMTDPIPSIQADPDLLQQVFINLYLNSLQAMSHGGVIRIHAGLAQDGSAGVSGEDPSRRLRICFEDNGPGIAPDHIEHIFDPFFTTKDIGEGTGLGLSVSYGIVKDHGGEIHVESDPGCFTRFIIDLPIKPADRNEEPEREKS
ncbi:MAG: HAMP domain-containing protein [Deltaproteobacteria bacterium]|nr:HAMP domain-containing protein [Deltaproteobacteria bacterium]